MTVSQKISVSLLISVLLFAGFAALAFTGLFELVEARFYNPAVAGGLSREVDADVVSVGEFLEEVRDRFASVLDEGAVKRSFLPNQGAEDIFERTKLFGSLMESLPGLQSVRFVDSSGKRIHFSTSREDILRSDRLSVLYRNYGDASSDLPFESIASGESSYRLVVDASGERLVFSFPFKDSFDVYKGSALFSLSVRAIVERLIADGRLKVGEDLSLVAEPAGVVSGLPKVGRAGLSAAIAQVLSEGVRGPVPLARSSEGASYALVSGKTRDGFFVSRVVSEALFSFPVAMKAILLASFFLTVFLIVFLFLNLHQDSMVVVRERIKRFQISLLEEYYDRKEEIDWERWTRELDQRREEVRGELKRGFGRAVHKRNEANVDALIDKSWDDLLTALASRRPATAPVAAAQIDERKLQDILGRILAATPVSVAVPSGAPIAPSPVSVSAAQGAVEELEEIEELEDLEELDDEAAGAAAPAAAAPREEEPGEPEELEELEELEEQAVSPQVAAAPASPASEEPEELEELEEIEELEAEFEEEPTAVETAPAEPLSEAEEFAELESVDDTEHPFDFPELAQIPESPAAEEEPEEIVPFEAEPFPDAVVSAEALEDVSDVEEEPAELEDIPAFVQERSAALANIRVVFDENDDIPYIIETSGIELVDDDLNAVIGFLDRGGDDVEELEDADETEEAELVEELSDAESEEGPEPGPVPMSETMINQLAREIEFAPVAAEEEQYVPDENIDVSSPFDTLFGHIEAEPMEELAAAAVFEAEEDAEELPSVTEIEPESYRPYFAGSASSSALLPYGGELITLESVEGELEEEPAELVEALDSEAAESAFIVVKDGIAYVSDSAYEEEDAPAPNPDLKDLAQSVIGQGR